MAMQETQNGRERKASREAGGKKRKKRKKSIAPRPRAPRAGNQGNSKTTGARPRGERKNKKNPRHRAAATKTRRHKRGRFGLVWFGSRPVPDALAHGQHSPLCRHDWARRIAVVRSQGLPDC